MSMVVQHNLQALNANRMLGITTSQQSKSAEKLSSGYKINRAADDAAGLSISEKMRKQIRGLDRASSNAQDGISSVQTAEGALTEVHSMLQRMNELANQAANGTNSEDDRQSIQNEINQLTTEIDRVAETTKFNETYLLKGDNVNTKNVYMAAHDAGLKGTLTDNDTTAKFEMDVLKTGDSIMIGGKSYTIAETAADAQDNIEKALDKASATNKVKVTIDDEEYTWDGTTVTDKDGNKLYKQTDGSLSINKTSTGAAKTDIEALVQEGSTYKIGTGAEVTVMKDNGEGVDKNNSSIITDDKAYALVREALEQANNIGTVDGKATVAAGAIKESSASLITTTLYDADGNAITAADDLKDALDAGGKVYTAATAYTAGSAAAGSTGGTATGAKVAATMNTPTTAEEFDAQNAFLKKLEDGGVAINTSASSSNYDGDTTITMTGYTFTYSSGTSYDVKDSAGNALGTITLSGTFAQGTDSAVKSGTATLAVSNEAAQGTDYNYSAGDPSKVSFDINKGYASVADKLVLNLHVGADADMTNKIEVGIETMNSAYLGIKGLDIVGKGDDGGAAATYAIDAISDAIAKVSAQRSSLGAIQNRLEHTISNVDNIVENTTSAESAIRDTDMAEEMVEYSKNNILAQAGQSMLAQANQSTQGVLSILG